MGKDEEKEALYSFRTRELEMKPPKKWYMQYIHPHKVEAVQMKKDELKQKQKKKK